MLINIHWEVKGLVGFSERFLLVTKFFIRILPDSIKGFILEGFDLNKFEICMLWIKSFPTSGKEEYFRTCMSSIFHVYTCNSQSKHKFKMHTYMHSYMYVSLSFTPCKSCFVPLFILIE